MSVKKLTERTRSAISSDDDRVLVLGGGHLGGELASRLADDRIVTLIDDDESVVRRAASGVTAYCAEPTDVDALGRAAADEVDLAVVATEADRRSVLATQLLRVKFDVECVVVLVNDPALQEVIDPIGTEIVCVPDRLIPNLTAAVDRTIREREGS